MLGFESFCVYGFCIEYPKDFSIKLDARSRWDEGSVAFEPADEGSIVVSWGSLAVAKERYACLDEHVRSSVDEIGRKPKVKSVELVESRKDRVNLHEAIFSRIRMRFSLRRFWPFGKTFQEEIHSLHLYCEDSGRYFVVYGMTSPDRSDHLSRIFEEMVKTFVCHEKNLNSTR